MLSTTGFEYRRRKKIVDEQNISTLYTINIYNHTIHEIDDKVRESSLMKKKATGKSAISRRVRIREFLSPKLCFFMSGVLVMPQASQTGVIPNYNE